MANKKIKLRTQEEKTALVNQIKTAQNEGKTITEALKLAGIKHANYYAWRKKINSAKPAKRVKTIPSLLTIPLHTPNQIIVLMGDPAQVNAALERLVQIGAR